MNYVEAMEAAFLDELEKIATRGKFLKGLSHRLGRRPMRVGTMLKKEKEGTLYTHTKKADSTGSLVATAMSDPPGTTGKPAEPVRQPGEVPSREDGREMASTKIPSFARHVLAPAAVNTPEEHGNY